MLLRTVKPFQNFKLLQKVVYISKSSLNTTIFLVLSLLLFILIFGGTFFLLPMIDFFNTPKTYTIKSIDVECREYALQAVKIPPEEYIKLQKIQYCDFDREPILIITISVPIREHENFAGLLELAYRPDGTCGNGNLSSIKTIKSGNGGRRLNSYVNKLDTDGFFCSVYEYEYPGHFEYVFKCTEGLSQRLIYEVITDKCAETAE